MASVHKHIRSGTASKRPTTAIAEGQIALATNIASPGLFFKDSTGATIVKIGPVHVGATAPNATPAGSAGNSIGEVWLDTSLTPIGVKIYDGTAFVNATPIGSTTVQGLLELATDAETQTGSDAARVVTPASLQSKLSDSTSTTSASTIASSTAVKAAFDLAGLALPKAGGTVTGNLEIGTAGSLSFEGATADGFETTIAVVDPTADRTITLPNTTGTVVTTGDTGTVTSTMLLDGTIVNVDINAAAAIVDTKLATIATAGKVSNSATTATNANTASAIVARDASGNFTAGTITAALTGAASSNVLKAGDTMTGVLAVTAGTAALPAITPSGDPNTGIYSPGVDQLAVATNGVQRLSIGSTGNIDIDSNTVFIDAVNNRVGIGNSAPSAALDVSYAGGTSSNDVLTLKLGADVGNFTSRTLNTRKFAVIGAANYSNASKNIGMMYLDSDASTSRLWLGGGATGIYDATEINFVTAATTTSTSGLQRMVITSGGLVGIGTTSPAHQLQVSTDSAGKPSTNTWTIVSDERIKEEIELADLDLCYEAVKSIPLKRFKWKDEVYTEEQVRDRRKLGWIAQDVETVFPKAVGTYEFKYNQVFEETIIPAVEEELDGEGNVTTPAQPERIEKGELISEDVIEDCRDLNSDQLYAAMYGAIQKLMVKVETLEAEVASLKAL